MKQFNNSDGDNKLVIISDNETTIGRSKRQNNIHNSDLEINSAIILTFVFVNCNTETVAVNIRKTCVNTNKGRVYVMVYWSKKRQVYKEYKYDIRCDGTVVRYILPLCSLD